MSKVQIAALNRASKEITGMTFLSAIHQQHPDILQVVHKALEYYGMACLEKAANNAKPLIEPYTWDKHRELDTVIPDANHQDIAITVDKSSITSKDNLA